MSSPQGQEEYRRYREEREKWPNLMDSWVRKPFTCEASEDGKVLWIKDAKGIPRLGLEKDDLVVLKEAVRKVFGKDVWPEWEICMVESDGVVKTNSVA